VAGAPSLRVQPSPFATSQTVVISFSKPVDNPVLHIDRLGGSVTDVSNNTLSNSSVWTLSGSVATGAVTMSKLAGNVNFSLAGSVFQRTPNVAWTGAGNSECAATTLSTACGSVQFNGSGISSLTFTVTWAGPDNNFGGPATSGDGIEFALSLPETTVVIKKQSVGGTGTFTFTGTNGVASASLNTATTNPISSASSTVTDNSKAITITEAALAPYTLTSVSCADQTPTAITSSVSGGVLTIAPAAYNGGGQTITCTFTNTKPSTIAVTEVSNGGTGAFTFTGNNGWASQTLNTVTAGTGVTGATQTLTTVGTAVSRVPFFGPSKAAPERQE